MKKSLVLVGVWLTLVAAGAQAHSHLKLSSPAEGAVLAEAPAAVRLTFSEASRITAVWIQKDQGPKQALKAAPAAPAAQISVAVPKLAVGSYTLSWRVIGDDSHIVAGELHFKVAPMTLPTKQ